MIKHLRTAAFSLIAITATGCTIPLRQARDEAALPASDPLDARLERCSTLDSRKVEDPDCQSAFAEARKRILPPPTGR
jgi:conjugative transfer region protein TrbK